MEKITDDTFTDILLHLPGKQAAQFCSISKHYNSFLSNPKNIKTHSIKNNLILLVSKTHDSKGDKYRYTLRLATYPNVEKRSLNPLLDGYTLIAGATDGLFLLCGGSGSGASLHIWNPFLDVIRAVPVSPLSLKKPYSSVSLGFGSDVGNGDCKIVHIVLPIEKTKHYCCGPPREPVKRKMLQVEVFSLKTGGWKSLVDCVPERVRYVNRDSVALEDGRIYWLGSVFDDGVKDLDVVVWFDLGRECFGEVSLPEGRVGKSMRLTELRGRLCLFSYSVKEHCEVWVLDGEVWVKNHVIGSPLVEVVVRPLGASWNGDFLLTTTSDPLVCYDSRSGEVKGSGLCDTDFSSVVPYLDSLVWFPYVDSGPTESGVEAEPSGCCSAKKARTEADQGHDMDRSQ